MSNTGFFRDDEESLIHFTECLSNEEMYGQDKEETVFIIGAGEYGY